MSDPHPPFVITDFQMDLAHSPINSLYWELFGTDGYTYDKWALQDIKPFDGCSPEYLSLNNYSAYGYLSFGSKPVVAGSTFWGALFPLNWELHQFSPDIPYANCFRLWLRPGIHGHVSNRGVLRKWVVPVTVGP